ncbi:MAG: winged helix DNA-binding domain-containing protein [Ferruginibacter sp.]
MTLPDIAQYRMLNQQMITTGFSKPAEMVAWLGAMQAQEYAHSKWAIGQRLPGSVDADIERDFTNGDILRTHLLRPTWHFVTPADIRWILALTAPRVHVANAFTYREMELDNKIFNRANDVLVTALQGGKQLTRTVLQSALKRKKIIADGIRLSCIMMHAELDGIICSGARAGKQFTYALLDERVPQVSHLDKDEALAELTKRYFTSRGPVTLKDFSVWSGLTVAQVKRGMEMVSSHFIHEAKGDEIYYFPPTGPLNKKLFQHAWLLPPYDEYIMGYKNKEAIFFNRNKMNPAPELLFLNTIIIEGQIAGSWRRTIEKNAIWLEYHLFNPFNKKQLTAVNVAIRKLSKFMGLPVLLIKN